MSAGLDMVWPLAIRHIIDGILLAENQTPAQKSHGLGVFGGIVIGLLLLKQAIDTFRSYRTTVLNSKVIFRLRQRLFDRLLGLSLNDLSEMKSGGIVSRLSSDVDAVSGLVQQAVISPGVAIIRVVLTLGILMALSWRWRSRR